MIDLLLYVAFFVVAGVLFVPVLVVNAALWTAISFALITAVGAPFMGLGWVINHTCSPRVGGWVWCTVVAAMMLALVWYDPLFVLGMVGVCGVLVLGAYGLQKC